MSGEDSAFCGDGGSSSRDRDWRGIVLSVMVCVCVGGGGIQLTGRVMGGMFSW